MEYEILIKLFDIIHCLLIIQFNTHGQIMSFIQTKTDLRCSKCVRVLTQRQSKDNKIMQHIDLRE